MYIFCLFFYLTILIIFFIYTVRNIRQKTQASYLVVIIIKNNLQKTDNEVYLNTSSSIFLGSFIDFSLFSFLSFSFSSSSLFLLFLITLTESYQTSTVIPILTNWIIFFSCLSTKSQRDFPVLQYSFISLRNTFSIVLRTLL